MAWFGLDSPRGAGCLGLVWIVPPVSGAGVSGRAPLSTARLGPRLPGWRPYPGTPSPPCPARPGTRHPTRPPRMALVVQAPGPRPRRQSLGVRRPVAGRPWRPQHSTVTHHPPPTGAVTARSNNRGAYETSPPVPTVRRFRTNRWVEPAGVKQRPEPVIIWSPPPESSGYSVNRHSHNLRHIDQSQV